jgi:hypothetical protein
MDYLSLIFSPNVKIEENNAFIAKKSFEEQKKLAEAYKKIYGKHVPLLLIVGKGLPKPEKEVFLVRRDATTKLLIAYIRQKVSIQPSEAIFTFIRKKDEKQGSVIPNMDSTFGVIYDEYANGAFLIIDVCLENVFGN